MINKINNLCDEFYEKIVDIRHKIHMYTEVGYEEFKTSKLIADTFINLDIELKINVAKTDVVGLIKGKYPGKTILIRAYMDALRV